MRHAVTLDEPHVLVLGVVLEETLLVLDEQRPLAAEHLGGEKHACVGPVLRHAAGEDVSQFEREVQASGVMMIPIPKRGLLKRVMGVDEAAAVDGVEEVKITAKPDQLLELLPEAGSYLGFIFARAAAPGEVVQALRAAHSLLDFRIDRLVM